MYCEATADAGKAWLYQHLQKPCRIPLASVYVI